MSIKNLINKLKLYNYTYRKGISTISNKTYDTNLELLRSLNPSNLYLKKTEPEFFENKKKIFHPFNMLSIKKIYNFKSLDTFIYKTNKKIKSITDENIILKISPKLDGFAARNANNILISRGDGRYGYDVSNLLNIGVRRIGGKNKGIGEIIVVKSYFKKYLSNLFDHPRNMIIAIITSDSIEIPVLNALTKGMIHFIPYKFLASVLIDSNKLIKNYRKIYGFITKNIDYPIDGLVIEIFDSKLKKILGSSNIEHNWQIAVKIKGQTADTIVTKIYWQVGRTGYITPILEVKPIFISGSIIKRISAYNIENIEKLNIGENSKIRIVRSGEIIPKIESILKSTAPPKTPILCPICRMKLKLEGKKLRCLNFNCNAKIEKKIFYWFKKLANNDFLGIKTIEKITNNGYDNLESIYSLGLTDIKSLGFGYLQSKNIFNAVYYSKINPVQDWKFLTAFGISCIGPADSSKLLSNISIYEIPYLNIEKILSTNVFGENTNKIIISSIKKKKYTIINMLKIKFNLIYTSTI